MNTCHKFYLKLGKITNFTVGKVQRYNLRYNLPWHHHTGKRMYFFENVFLNVQKLKKGKQS